MAAPNDAGKADGQVPTESTPTEAAASVQDPTPTDFKFASLPLKSPIASRLPSSVHASRTHRTCDAHVAAPTIDGLWRWAISNTGAALSAERATKPAQAGVLR